jgi:hypothetical protein
MSSATILIVGAVVFALLLVGLFLTLIEAQRDARRPDLLVGVESQRIVDKDELAARGSASAASE